MDFFLDFFTMTFSTPLRTMYSLLIILIIVIALYSIYKIIYIIRNIEDYIYYRESTTVYNGAFYDVYVKKENSFGNENTFESSANSEFSIERKYLYTSSISRKRRCLIPIVKRLKLFINDTIILISLSGIIYFSYPHVKLFISEINFKSKFNEVYLSLANSKDLDLSYTEYFNFEQAEVSLNHFFNIIERNVDDNIKKVVEFRTQEDEKTNYEGSIQEVIEEQKMLNSIQTVQNKFVYANTEDLMLIYKKSLEFGIDPAYVFALVGTESHFKDYEISKAKAYGLFQIRKPSAEETIEKVYKEKGIFVTKDFMLNKRNNILLGTGYLSLLKDRYLKLVSDNKKKMIVLTYAYNVGITKILNIFYKKNQAKAQEKINELTQEEIKAKIVEFLVKNDIDEGVTYLHRVYSKWSRFNKEFKKFGN
ncbi:transglycosylase SLT domain-containing protein [Arcobacter roscoffensis]|uniref:Transglycosylase SLT domain-containing protein n=1 Tax=Arcobacter roscoffensis TaxID=2961520 RepID=A0ABY5E402_9BACT|nr:transglycosylase SLT domain-containing protein [Arcobacter roscoffensis]UTJ05890.1 transglycosylase SLT domain-containing protein [Arcobacter roscoffensis]